MLILLVDDDAEDVMIFRSAVKDIDENWQVMHIDDGEKFLQFIDNATILPDFILLDINMPRVNGLTCLKHINKNNRFTNTSIYMLSTSTNDRDISEAYKNGAHLYIRKPHSYTELVRILHTCVNKEFATKNDRDFKKFLIVESKQLER